MACGDGVKDELHSGKYNLGFGRTMKQSTSCKWVYRLKEASDSTNPKYEARLVAKGFLQEYGVNFDEIFSQVVNMTTLPFMLVVVAAKNLELIQLDVKTTFLHADLKEEIYMEQLKGLVASG